MSQRPAEAPASAYVSAKQILDTFRAILAASDIEFPQGKEKVVFRSPQVPYVLCLYKMATYSENRDRLRVNRMQQFAQLGPFFSPDRSVSPSEEETLLADIKVMITIQNGDSDTLQHIKQSFHNLIFLTPEQTEKKPIIAIQANWCTEKHGQFVGLETLDHIDNPTLLICKLLEALSLSEAAGLTIDDLKDDNVLVTDSTIKLIDLGPMDYDLPGTFVTGLAHTDPIRWEKLRTALLIQKITQPDNKIDLANYSVKVPTDYVDADGNVRMADSLHYEYATLKNWAEKRIQQPIANAFDAIIHRLIQSTLQSSGEKKKRPTSYPEVIKTWLTYLTQYPEAQQTLGMPLNTLQKIYQETSEQTHQILQEQAANIIARAGGRPDIPAIHIPINVSARQSSSLHGALLENLAESETDVTISEAAEALITIRDIRDSISCQTTQQRLNNLMDSITLELGRINTLRRSHAQKPIPNHDIGQHFRETLQSILSKYTRGTIDTFRTNHPKLDTYTRTPTADTTKKETNHRLVLQLPGVLKKLLLANKQRLSARSGAIGGAVLCALFGAGGVGVSVFLLITSSSVGSALCFGLLITAAVLMLLTAAPAYVANHKRLSQFRQTNVVEDTQKLVQELNNQYLQHD